MAGEPLHKYASLAHLLSVIETRLMFFGALSKESSAAVEVIAQMIADREPTSEIKNELLKLLGSLEGSEELVAVVGLHSSGRELSAIRASRGLSLKELSSVSGISEQMLVEIEGSEGDDAAAMKLISSVLRLSSSKALDAVEQALANEAALDEVQDVLDGKAPVHAESWEVVKERLGL